MASQGKVLVLVSSGDGLPLRNSRCYRGAGYCLNELTVLVARGVEVSDVFHAVTPGAQFQPVGDSGCVIGPTRDHASYSSVATVSDPDGNGWLLQEITTRLPGRIEAEATTYPSPNDFADTLRRADEALMAQSDKSWPAW